jgi:hypothetical protein
VVLEKSKEADPVKKATHLHRLAPALVAALAVCASDVSRACAVCMGAPDSKVAPAMNAAIFLMLGVIGTVLGSVGGFVLYLRKRAKSPGADLDELLK